MWQRTHFGSEQEATANSNHCWPLIIRFLLQFAASPFSEFIDNHRSAAE